MQVDFDNDLLAYFTDVEQRCDEFKQMLAAPILAKRLFVVWGIGVVGKSSLLRMFRLHCRETGVPVLSTVPGLGLLLAKLGGICIDALTDLLLSHGFKMPDIDLLLNPADKLTEDFLADVAQAADDQRIVLMLDNFEQMPGLEDWTLMDRRRRQ